MVGCVPIAPDAAADADHAVQVAWMREREFEINAQVCEKPRRRARSPVAIPPA
jgi:hypothetical protein